MCFDTCENYIWGKAIKTTSRNIKIIVTRIAVDSINFNLLLTGYRQFDTRHFDTDTSRYRLFYVESF